MPNPDPIKARIEALRGKRGASIQGGAKIVSPSPVPASDKESTTSGGIDRAKLEALRGKGTTLPTPQKDSHNFATQKDLEENRPTPQLDAFLEQIVAKA